MSRNKIIKVTADPVEGTECYKSLRLRDDVAEKIKTIRGILRSAGAVLTTSGGRRSLTQEVTANRSLVSLHYLGRAIDLCLQSGMKDPRKDPYVVEAEKIWPSGQHRWRVFARCDPEREAEALAAGAVWQPVIGWTYRKAKLGVFGLFLDVTDLMARHGFDRIRSRASFGRMEKPSAGSAEWWHFQFERGLRRKITTFGDELRRIYTDSQLQARAPARMRRAFGRKWTGQTFR